MLAVLLVYWTDFHKELPSPELSTSAVPRTKQELLGGVYKIHTC